MAIGVFLFTKSNFIRDTELPAFFSELSEGDSIYRLIEQIHNLVDLARRPVLINMIREIVPDLEAIQVAGRRIQGIDIYDRFVKKHLDRDEGKHIFTKTHKITMMEQLSADLWASGDREWDWDRMEHWLDEFLAEHPRIAGRYTVSAEVLNQDFRNSTAVVRRANEKSAFRFAHTSLQEYFLACWMMRAFESKDTNGIASLPLPSDETLLFLGQLFASSESGSAMKHIEQLIESGEDIATLSGQEARVNSVAVDSDRGFYLSGSDDRTIKVWDARNHACVATLSGHTDGVRSVAVDSERGRYVSGSDDHTIKVWDAETRECVTTANNHQEWVREVVVDGERNHYVSASDDSTLRIWDAAVVETKTILFSLPEGEWAQAKCILENGIEIHIQSLTSPGAARFLNWTGIETQTNRRTVIPYEVLASD